MTDVVKQAVAKASKPFLDSIGELLGHEFTAGELWAHVRAFFTLASMLLMVMDRQNQKKEE